MSLRAGRDDLPFPPGLFTVSSIDATSCVMTTNGYAQTFRRQSPTRWEAAEAPAGECGIVETTTLEDGGGVHWTMTVRRVATRKTGQLECVAAAAESERYSWKDVKRTLPCTSIQPGAIER